jgi:hypothetical protein
MHDVILESFLASQLEAGLALAGSSDLLDLVPLDAPPVRRYLVDLRCRGLVCDRSGAVTEADHFQLGIRFPDDYLRHVRPPEVVTLFGPQNTFHPNVAAPFMCLGRLVPGTSLVDLIYQVFEILTYNKVTMREDDALNRDACVWARGNLMRFPIDRRALKRLVPVPVAGEPGESGR